MPDLASLARISPSNAFLGPGRWRYPHFMTDRYPLSDKQVFGSDVDDDDMDAILNAMDRWEAGEKQPDGSKPAD